MRGAYQLELSGRDGITRELLGLRVGSLPEVRFCVSSAFASLWSCARSSSAQVFAMAYSVPSPVEPQLIVAPHPTPTRAPRSGSVVTARPPAPGVSSHSIHVLAGHVQVTTREGSHELKAGALLVLSLRV